MDYEATLFVMFLAIMAVPSACWVWVELMAWTARTAVDVYVESKRKLLRG